MYSAVDGEYVFDNLIKAIYDAENNTSVISGMAVTQTGAGANQAVDVASGVYLVAGTRVVYAGGNIAAPAADATNPRKDILVADNAGALTFTQGTAASALPVGETGVRTYQPVPPNIPASRVILAEVWRAANDNTIANADITEKFILVPSRMIGRELFTAQGQIPYSSAAQTPAALATGTSGYFLKTQGAGANPVWAATANPLFTEYTSNDTWTKPAIVTTVYVEVVGGGGGGRNGSDSNGGSGGGGASISRGIFDAADLGATEAITVGAGGTTGVAGGTSDFGTKLYAYGGGTGEAASGAGTGGGGGGGTGSVGSNGAGGTGGNGGSPTIQGSSQGDSLGGRGARGGTGATDGYNAEYGGGGGGGGNAGGAANSLGGSSIYGAGAGGSGATSGATAGKAGGKWNSYSAGGGGAAGANGTSRGYGCGDGGGGGTWTGGVGGNGGTGGAPGGGGGGGGAGNGVAGGTGGTGGAGVIRVWSW